MDTPDGYGPELIASNADLRADVAGLREDLRTYTRGTNITVQTLHDEIETHRILARYNRRTWFEVMTWLVLGTSLLADLARSYGHSGWWDLMFWTSSHGAGGTWEVVARVVGFLWQLTFVIVMTSRAQVPQELQHRVASGAPKLRR